MRKWTLTVRVPWLDAEDPNMTEVVEAKTRGKAMWKYVLMARDAGYALNITDVRARLFRDQ